MTRYTPADFDTGASAGVPVSQRVVRAVATETETDPLELDRLFDVINPESLDALFEPTKGGAPRAAGGVTFQYEGCAVTVYANGDVEVAAHPATQAGSRTESTSANCCE